MRSLVTDRSRLTSQATAHSLHTQAWAATRPLARHRQSAVCLHLRNPSLIDYYSMSGYCLVQRSCISQQSRPASVPIITVLRPKSTTSVSPKQVRKKLARTKVCWHQLCRVVSQIPLQQTCWQLATDLATRRTILACQDSLQCC